MFFFHTISRDLAYVGFASLVLPHLALYVTKPGNMGPNALFMEIELAIVHESLGNAEKDAKKQSFDILIRYFSRIV